MTRAAMFVSLLLAAGCTETDIPIPDRAPGAPNKADEAGFTIEGLRGWYLVGNALTPGDDLLEISIESTEPVEVIDLWLDRQFAGRGHASGGRVEIAVDIESLMPGEHEILLAADGAELAFAQRFFTRSHPLYVVVSNDWDDPDNDDDARAPGAAARAAPCPPAHPLRRALHLHRSDGVAGAARVPGRLGDRHARARG